MSTTKTQALQIIGLRKALTDPNTGAPVAFFTLSQYTVRLTDGGGSQAVVQGYISQDAHMAGKRPLSHVAVDFSGTPEGDTEQWLYEQILAKEGIDISGATAVYEAAAEPVDQAA